MCVSVRLYLSGVLKWKYLSSSKEFKGKLNKLPSNISRLWLLHNSIPARSARREKSAHSIHINWIIHQFAYSIRWKSMLLESLLPICQRISWSCLHWSMWYTQRLLRLSGRLLFELHQRWKLKTNLNSVEKISTSSGGGVGGSETASSQDSG